MSNTKRFHRQSIRLRGYDYRQPGTYFVTICTNARYRFFDEPYLRRIAERHWESLPERFDGIALDAWIVMPDHMHALLTIARNPAEEAEPSTAHLLARSLGAFILTYKSLVTRNAHKLNIFGGHSLWQRGYWERVIRDDQELNVVRQYIRDNPKREQDNLDALLDRMSYRL